MKNEVQKIKVSQTFSQESLEQVSSYYDTALDLKEAHYYLMEIGFGRHLQELEKLLPGVLTEELIKIK